MAGRKVTWEKLETWGGGNFSSHRTGTINWLIHNFCTHCQKRIFKGTVQCPYCHLRLRTCPRKPRIPIEKRALYKVAQSKARKLLLSSGWTLPPQTCGAK